MYTSPLSDTYFLCILSKSMAYFFISHSALQRTGNFINLFLTLFFILFLSKNFYLTEGHKDFSYVFIWKFYIFGFTFRSIINF